MKYNQLAYLAWYTFLSLYLQAPLVLEFVSSKQGAAT